LQAYVLKILAKAPSGRVHLGQVAQVQHQVGRAPVGLAGALG